MYDEILGGALLIAGIWEDYESGLISQRTMENRVSLIKKYESGLITLQDLNRVW